MRKILAFLLAFLLAAPAYADDSVSDYLKNSLGIDIETADAQTLKSVVEGIDESISPYSAAIELCLERLKSMGESKWVEQYREKSPDDLSGLSYDELVMLKDRINLAIWQSQDWQEVTVPQGVWEVGKDIPAGTWTVKCADVGRNSYMLKECHFSWGEYLSEDGQSVQWRGRYDWVTIYNPNNRDYKDGQLTEYTLTVKNGDYIIIGTAYNRAVFTPYVGKPSLGFK